MHNVQTIYFIHKTHLDIGYTHDQPIVWDLHDRFVDEAIEYAERSSDSEADGAFRWTLENMILLQHWLQQATPSQLERFTTLERAGRIEVTAMLANLTPLCDTDQLIESFQLVKILREDYGFSIRHAMNDDVNGHNWPLVDVLLDLGIEAFTMAINDHFGAAPFDRPNAFLWAGPSGRKIMAWNGWTYSAGWHFGIGRDAVDFETVWWPRIERHLARIEYPLQSLMIQSFHPFGDNGSAFAEFSQFIDEWNGKGKQPRLRFATPQMWWTAVKEEVDLLPTYQGDWTDYWNFGCISSAREQGIHQTSRVRLRSADALAAAARGKNNDSSAERVSKSVERYRRSAWFNLNLWTEHSWGADNSIRLPDSEDVAAQWNHKAHVVQQARSLSFLLQRDGLAALAQKVERNQATDLLVFNPLPWPQSIGGEVSRAVTTPRGVPVDRTAGRHFQDRELYPGAVPASGAAADDPVFGSARSQAPLLLKPVEVPGFGYNVVSQADLVEPGEMTTVSEETIVEDERYRMVFDVDQGGLVSWYDKTLKHELIDQSAGYAFNGYVHEEVTDRNHPLPRKLLFERVWAPDQTLPGWKPDWEANRRAPTKLVSHKVYRTPLGVRIIQRLQAPGCIGLLNQSVFVPDSANYVECEAWWHMGLDTHPQAAYILYPFNLPQAIARIDLGSQAMVVGKDQLPGVCRDYFTVQQWVDFSNEEFGVTIAMPDNPMVQLGDFHFAQHQADFTLERAMLLGWVTNNYWETNFRAHQPGQVHARYRILPYQGSFDEARAHRFGLEAANNKPLVQHLGELTENEPPYPGVGSLLNLPGHDGNDSSVLTLHVKPANEGSGVIVRLINASGETQMAHIGSAQLQITAARVCNLLEEPQTPADLEDGSVSLSLLPRQIVVVELTVE